MYKLNSPLYIPSYKNAPFWMQKNWSRKWFFLNKVLSIQNSRDILSHISWWPAPTQIISYKNIGTRCINFTCIAYHMERLCVWVAEGDCCFEHQEKEGDHWRSCGNLHPWRVHHQLDLNLSLAFWTVSSEPSSWLQAIDDVHDISKIINLNIVICKTLYT